MTIESDLAACKYEVQRLTKKINAYHRTGDMELIHPHAFASFNLLRRHLQEKYKSGATDTLFVPFETYRSPVRQLELFKQVPKVTKAGPFQSAHQYGLAVDFVPFDGGTYNWHENNDYAFLAKAAKEFGLSVPYAWDKVHVEHPLFREVRRVLINE